jgi:hypothetical protein
MKIGHHIENWKPERPPEIEPEEKSVISKEHVEVNVS